MMINMNHSERSTRIFMMINMNHSERSTRIFMMNWLFTDRHLNLCISHLEKKHEQLRSWRTGTFEICVNIRNDVWPRCSDRLRFPVDLTVGFLRKIRFPFEYRPVKTITELSGIICRRRNVPLVMHGDENVPLDIDQREWRNKLPFYNRRKSSTIRSEIRKSKCPGIRQCIPGIRSWISDITSSSTVCIPESMTWSWINQVNGHCNRHTCVKSNAANSECNEFSYATLLTMTTNVTQNYDKIRTERVLWKFFNGKCNWESGWRPIKLRFILISHLQGPAAKLQDGKSWTSLLGSKTLLLVICINSSPF